MGFNYLKAVCEATVNLDITNPEWSVLIVLAEHANKDTGVCWPGYSRIVKRTKLSYSSVQRAVKALENKNLVRITRKKGPRGNDTNRYRLDLQYLKSLATLPAAEPDDDGESTSDLTQPECGMASEEQQDDSWEAKGCGQTSRGVRSEGGPNLEVKLGFNKSTTDNTKPRTRSSDQVASFSAGTGRGKATPKTTATTVPTTPVPAPFTNFSAEAMDMCYQLSAQSSVAPKDSWYPFAEKILRECIPAKANLDGKYIENLLDWIYNVQIENSKFRWADRIRNTENLYNSLSRRTGYTLAKQFALYQNQKLKESPLGQDTKLPDAENLDRTSYDDYQKYRDLFEGN